MNGKETPTNPTAGSPKRQLQKSLKSKSNVSDSQQSNRAIDIMRLLSRKQQSRESKINYNPCSYNIKIEPKVVRHSDYVSNFRLSNFSKNEDEENYSTYANRAALRNGNMLDESFLSTNQNSGIIGVLMYILFIVFIIIEVITTIYVIPKSTSHNAFYFQTALLTILLSELCYYLLLRYLSSQTKKRLFLHRSARASFDKLMQLSKTNKYQQQQRNFASWLLEKPYLLLGVIAGIVVICQMLYSKLATQVIFLFEQKNEGYMVSTIFWSNFALPYIFSNFYLNRPSEQRNSKVKLFSIIIFAYIIESLIEGFLFFSLMIFNLCQTYIHSKREFDTFHINQFIKLLLLCLTIVWIIIKYLYLTHESLFNEQVATFIGTLIFHVIILSLAMFLTRVVATKYLKQQLYRHYFTETGINLAFITAAFIMNLMYLDSYHRNSSQIMTAVVINLIFLGCLGVIIYLEGRDKMLVVIDSDNFQQQHC